MATRAKVNEYLVASDSEENYRMLTQGTMGQMAAKLSIDGQMDASFIAQVQEKLYERTHMRIMEHGAGLIGEMFTDEDLDQLIAFNQLPVAAKFREVMPQMQQEMVAFLVDGNLVTEAMIEEIFDELEADDHSLTSRPE